MMKVSLGPNGGLERKRTTLLGLLVASDELAVRWLPAALSAAIRGPIEAKDFTGRELESALVYAGRRRLLLIGLGARSKATAETYRRGAAALVKRARQLKIDGCALALSFGGIEATAIGRALGEGLELGGYSFHGAKTDAAPKPVRSVVVHAIGGVGDQRRLAEGLRVGGVVGRAQCLARDLGNQPANVATPRYLAAQARQIVRGSGIRLRVIALPELRRRKFGGLLGVARGSVEPPFFLELEWRPRSVRKSICLIGKGLTFDSGGISLKPAASMEEMKFDMCGGAAVLGAFAVIAKLRPKVHVFGLVPCTENMPGGRAIKPGDVLTTYGGVSVEVTNTDAEGRLVLADALGRAKELGADYTVDLATLTGAVVVALGHRATGLFCNHDDLAARLKRAAEESGERLWPLPLWDDYLEEMKSTVADVKNSGSRFGGAVTAAAFLQKFAGKLPWAHLDIAGTAWDTPRNELYEGGASGVGVRLLVHLLDGLE